MKRKFLKFLPLAAAVLLATSCSKDDSKDNNEVVNPEKQEVVINSGVKEVPFTVTVGTSQKLSKISYDKEETNSSTGKKDVVPEFESGDVNTVWMIVTGEGINESTEWLMNLADSRSYGYGFSVRLIRGLSYLPQFWEKM